MSLRIQSLEAVLGMRLFERRRNGVRLTGAGRDVLPRARAIVAMHDRLVDRASAKLVAGSVRLGIAERCSVHFFPQIFEQIQQEYTTLELTIFCEGSLTLQRKVQEGTLDLAVVMVSEELPSALQLSRPRLQWVASPDFAIGDWDALPIACNPEDNLFGAVPMSALQSRGVAYRAALCSANERAILSAVSSGTVIAVMAEGTVPEGLRVVSDALALPPLGRACIQLLEKPAPRTEAACLVKRELASLYPGS